MERNTESNIDQSPTVEVSVPIVESLYPILSAYVAGTLPQRWQKVRDEIIESDQKLSPLRAGEMAAALIVIDAQEELERLEQDVENEKFFYQVDDAMEVQRVNSLLIDISGTRTLILDVYEITWQRNAKERK